MAIQTNTGERAKLVRVAEGEEHITERISLYVNGATARSGAWNTVKNSLNRGQTISLGNNITSTANSNSNSSHGTLIYPSNKVSLTSGQELSIDITSVTDRSNITVYCVDSNVTTWTFYVSVVYMETVPSDFNSTFDINGWVNGMSHNTIASVSGSGSQSSKTLSPGTQTWTSPVSGSYYVCLVVHGYDSMTSNLSMGNMYVGEMSDAPYAQTVLTDTGIGIYPDYIKDGLTCWLDGNCNTRQGQNNTYYGWQDLSGNGNDFSIENYVEGDTWWTDGWTDHEYNSLGYKARYIAPRSLSANCRIYRDGFDPFTFLTGYTFEFVFKSWTNTSFNFLTGYPASNRVVWRWTSGEIGTRIVSGTDIKQTGLWNTNDVYTVTITRNPASSATAAAYTDLYINGKWIKSQSCAASNETISRLYLFCNAGTGNVPGPCFSFRAYNRPLTGSEIIHNSQIDRVRFNHGVSNPVALLKTYDVLAASNVRTALETNATLTKNADGTWTKGRTTSSTGNTQGCLWAEVDLTNFRYVHFGMNVTLNGGSDSYKVKGIVTKSTISRNSQNLTTMTDMGRSVGMRTATIDVSSMTGVYKVGIQTGTQLGTIDHITCWR